MIYKLKSVTYILGANNMDIKKAYDITRIFSVGQPKNKLGKKKDKTEKKRGKK